jgi:predicted nucleic acid-binding Zn ribbon protein
MSTIRGEQCGRPVAEAGPMASREATQAWLRSYRRQKKAWAWIFFFILVPIVFVGIWISMGELSSDVFYSVGGFVIVTGMLALWSSRKANKSWQGTLMDKEVRKVTIQNDSSTELRYYLTFETARGRTERLSVHPNILAHFDVGDRAVKVKGLDYPVNLDADEGERLCPVCSTIYDANAAECPRCRVPALDPRHLL